MTSPYTSTRTAAGSYERVCARTQVGIDGANIPTLRRNIVSHTAVVRLACPPPASLVQWHTSISSLTVALADQRFHLKQTW